MMTYKKQAGFSIIEVLVVVIMLSIGGVVGWKFYELQKNQSNLASSSQTTDSRSAETIPPINSLADLNIASKTIDEIDVDQENDTDLSQLDADLEEF